ncbi:ABC transporter permease [Cupriavidus oxalaticus]|uniref:ABC transporter permease n=1 Tax=Cupriavidus oxalaticus TaxID=96344 RepID=UPI003F734173
MNKMYRTLPSLGAPLAFLCAWAALGDPSSPVAPPPQTWMVQGAAMMTSGELPSAVLATMKTVLLAILVAGVAGTAMGATLGARRAVSDAMAPTLEFLRSIPPPTIVPVAMLLIGTSAGMAVSVVALATLWPVLLNVLQATRSIHPTLVNTGRTLRISRWSRLRHIYMPCIMPAMIAGLRVAAPLAIIVTLLVEMLATQPGIGRTLLSAQRNFDAPAVFALLFIVGLIGVGVNALFEWIERTVLKPLSVSTR